MRNLDYVERELWKQPSDLVLEAVAASAYPQNREWEGSCPLKEFLEKLKQRFDDNLPNYGDADSVLGLLYECFNKNNPYDNEQVKTGFEELYRQMNGMWLRETDQIIYPVCKLCRDHERSGFVEGIKIGVRLRTELREE